MKTSIVLILVSAFAAQASLHPRQEGALDKSAIPCSNECTPLITLAQQCVQAGDVSPECLCSAELSSAVEGCATCVQTQGDTVDPAQLAQLQSSLDSYQAQCSGASSAPTSSGNVDSIISDYNTALAGDQSSAEIADAITSVASDVQSSISVSQAISQYSSALSSASARESASALPEDTESGAISKSASLVGMAAMGALALL